MNANENTDVAKESPAEKRVVRKLTIDIVDIDAVLTAYPAVELVITQKTVDRKKLRPIVNALHAVGVQVPGVKAYYASDVAEGTDPEAEESAEDAAAGLPATA